jgi:hypothetical protein
VVGGAVVGGAVVAAGDAVIGGDTVVGGDRVASGSGVVGGDDDVADGAGTPVVKFRPQASQNWPALGAPHRGHASADGAEGAEGADVAEGVGVAPDAAELVATDAPEMRMPQVSQ